MKRAISLFMEFLGKLLRWEEKEETDPTTAVKPPQDATPQPESVIEPPTLKWGTKAESRHSVRVICDEERLSLSDKNDLCATVGAESGWQSYYLNDVVRNGKIIHKKGDPVIRENIENGKVWSTDFGIAQINDWFHIKPPTAAFPSSQYVLDNPEACIRWMCKQWKRGNKNWWIAYKHGAYKNYL